MTRPVTPVRTNSLRALLDQVKWGKVPPVDAVIDAENEYQNVLLRIERMRNKNEKLHRLLTARRTENSREK